jgi:hypothetical protein
LEKPTTCSIGSASRSQVSTTGTPAASSILRAAGVWLPPVTITPSGRRISIALSSRSSVGTS